MDPTITQALPVFSLVLVGFILKKAGLVRAGDGAVMTRFILNITLPAVIFLSVASVTIEPLRLALLAGLGMLVALTVRYTAGRAIRPLRLEPAVAGVVLVGTLVMNIGAFLFPLVQSLFGTEAVSRLAAFDLGNSILASSYGYYLASCHGQSAPCGWINSLRRALTVPILWACLLGVVVNLSGVSLPPFLLSIIKPVAAANMPLSMIALGSFLVFKFPRWRLMGLTVILRMGLGFALGQLLIVLFGLQGVERVAVGLGSAMPVGMITLVYAVAHGLDEEFAAAIISLSILAGLVLTPLMLLLY